MSDEEKKVAKKLLSWGYLTKGKMEEGKTYFTISNFFYVILTD